MGYASKAGRARISSVSPQAQAVCMRCGNWFNRVDLQFQFDWRGASMQNLFLLVCRECSDIPQQQLRSIVVPPDPVPIFYPSVESFEQDETNFRSVAGPPALDPMTGIPVPIDIQFLTQDSRHMTTIPIGQPVGLEQGAIMPLYEEVHFDIQLPVLSVTADGTGNINVTCYAVHNLVNNSQISVVGMSDIRADGFYSVTVISATAFSYRPVPVIAPASLLTGTTNIVTANVGLPRGYTQIPQT